MGDRLPGQISRDIERIGEAPGTGQRVGCDFHRRGFEKTPRLALQGEQAFQFQPEALVTRACLAKKGRPPALFDVQRQVEDLVDLVPAFRLHVALLSGQLAEEPDLREFPIPHDRFGRDL